MGHRAAIASLRALIGALLTAVIVAWLCDVTLSRVNVGSLGIAILLRGVDPYQGMTLGAAVSVSILRSGALIFAAMAIATVVGLLAGATYALSRDGSLRAFVWSIGTIGVSLPSFFWAMLLQLAVVLIFLRTQTRVLPTAGFGIDEHLLLPAVALAARPAAYVFRISATEFQTVRHGDYVRTAHAKGLSARYIARAHVLPNAAPALVGAIALGARTALSSLAIVEYVFTWNGAGFGFIHAAATGRTQFATAIAVIFALLFGLVTVATELVTSRRQGPR